ncbi:unnamed protein product [Candidula unifasciata]|uniref:Innexin n=1 Tax=Candidula unifasciata TaxID=100452 RepID=A0A8S3YS80_9EUPU|nr:unnamed protein product [Candidula unifasciata]
MKISRYSLTEDVVDRYNHTWGVALLLVISATTWLIPQIALVHQTTGPGPAKGKNMQKYTSNCWTPTQFTGAMISYAHSICGAAFSQAMQNAEDKGNKTFQAATLYHLASHETGETVEIGESKRFRPVTAEETIKQDDDYLSTVTETYSRISLVTFILAVCLKLPYIIWSLMSSFSHAEPSQILRSMEAAQCVDAGIRNQTCQDIFQAISYSKQKQSFFNTVLYLFLKITNVAVAIFGLLLVKSHVLLQPLSYGNGFDGVSVSKTGNDYYNSPLFCAMNVVSLQNIQNYMFQCIFEPSTDYSGTLNSPDNVERDFVYIRLYDVLHTILAFSFAVLTTVNGVNFLAWVVKLAPGPFRNRTFSSSKLPLDAYLLLLMARQNVGFVTAKNLELGFSPECRGEVKAGEELSNLTE